MSRNSPQQTEKQSSKIPQPAEERQLLPSFSVSTFRAVASEWPPLDAPSVKELISVACCCPICNYERKIIACLARTRLHVRKKETCSLRVHAARAENWSCLLLLCPDKRSVQSASLGSEQSVMAAGAQHIASPRYPRVDGGRGAGLGAIVAPEAKRRSGGERHGRRTGLHDTGRRGRRGPGSGVARQRRQRVGDCSSARRVRRREGPSGPCEGG